LVQVHSAFSNSTVATLAPQQLLPCFAMAATTTCNFEGCQTQRTEIRSLQLPEPTEEENVTTEPGSPLGSSLRQIRRARAFINDKTARAMASEALNAVADSTRDDMCSEAPDAEEPSMKDGEDHNLRMLRRAQAYGGSEAAKALRAKVLAEVEANQKASSKEQCDKLHGSSKLSVECGGC